MTNLVCGGVVGDLESLCVQQNCTVAKHRSENYGLNKTFSPEFKSSSDEYIMIQLNLKTVLPKYCIPVEYFTEDELKEVLEFKGTSNDLETLVNTLLTLIKSGYEHPWGYAFETISGVMDNNQDQRENESPIKKLNYEAEVDSWVESDFNSSEMKLKPIRKQRTYVFCRYLVV